jgi:hypothetical protein
MYLAIVFNFPIFFDRLSGLGVHLVGYRPDVFL